MSLLLLIVALTVALLCLQQAQAFLPSHRTKAHTKAQLNALPEILSSVDAFTQSAQVFSQAAQVSFSSSFSSLPGLSSASAALSSLSASLSSSLSSSLKPALDGLSSSLGPAIDSLAATPQAAQAISWVEGNQYLRVLDAAQFSWLPDTLTSTLAGQPLWQRILAGFLGVDVVGLGLDALLLSQLSKAMVGPTLSIDTTGLPLSYDARQISKFYKSRPQVVAARFSEILRISQPFLLGLLSDRSGLGKGSNSAPERAAQLRELISELGPAFIKVGQAVSVRPDLLQPAYLAELVKLQDQVPPFDSSLAVGILTRELGDPTLIFEDMDVFSKPVAAASLGQVYKARLKSGQDVAVKLQRPNMLVAVSLDLYIIRKMLELGEGVESVAEECKSFIGVIDNWAGRFIDELDYVKEVQNSNTFRDQMGDVSTTLGDAILVPRTYDQYCTGVVLTSEWIVGTKLSAIGQTELGKETKKKLLRVLLNSYLVQLLETGFLHADPHPGNFLITPEGKLCILDYGLMTEVQADKRYALLEYVSHLLAKDYDSTLQDLVTLEFIPPDVTSDPEKRKVVAPLLASVLEQLSGGGGAAAINVQEMGLQVEELSKQYPIVIPAYFGLIVRAFGALEGIGLSIDPAYSITSECFPYLARRLLSDDSERVRKSLRTFLYGKNSDFLDIDRLDELAKGFQTFSAAAAEAASGNDDFRQLQAMGLGPQEDGGESDAFRGRGDVAGLGMGSFGVGLVGMGEGASQGGMQAQSGVDAAVQEVVAIVFSAQGNYVQELLVKEAVRVSDALLRSASWTVLSGLMDLASGPTGSSPRPLLPFLTPLSLLPSLPFLPNPFRRREREEKEALAPAPMALAQTTMSGMSGAGVSAGAGVSGVRQELRRVLGPSEEDVAALRTLKRLLEIFAGIPPGASQYAQTPTATAAQYAAKLAGSEFNSIDMSISSGSISERSRGVIDQEDIQLLSTAMQSLLRALPAPAPGEGGEGGDRIALSPAQASALLASLQPLLPLVRRSGPGAAALARKFANQLVATQLKRFAQALEETKF